MKARVINHVMPFFCVLFGLLLRLPLEVVPDGLLEETPDEPRPDAELPAAAGYASGDGLSDEGPVYSSSILP